jgi:hypothetical protein
MTPTAETVLPLLDDQPRRVSDLGLLLVGLTDAGEQPVGQVLAARGLSLSALQKVVDELVRAGQVTELRGRELWDSFREGLPPNAKGRWFVRSG